MPGGFPNYYEPPEHRQGQQLGMISETETTSSRSSDRPAPSKGILKPMQTRKTIDPLAARFHRVGNPEQMQQPPTYPPAGQYGPDNSWHYDGYDSYDAESSYDHETDSQSASSELSTNTQATSVASDETVTDPGQTSHHVKHIRHVPLPTVGRVKARPRTRPPPTTEVVKSQPSLKRRVNIQIFPPGTSSQSQELQLSRKAEQDLLDKIDELEHEADGLRDARLQLNQELVEATNKLSLRVHEARDLQKSLGHERNARELLGREFQEQRTVLDECRSNFNLQKGMLDDVEKEKEVIKNARDSLDQRAGKLERDMTTQETKHKDLEVILVRRAAELERSSKALQDKVKLQDRQIKESSVQKDTLEKKFQRQEEDLKTLRGITAERDTLKCDAEKLVTSHANEVKKITAELNILVNQLESNKEQMKTFNDLTSERNLLRKEVETLQEQVKATAGEQGALKAENKSLKEKQQELETDIKDVEDEKETLQAGIDSVKGEIKGLQEEIKGFESQIEELQQEVKDTRMKAKELVEIEKSKFQEVEKQAATDKLELEGIVAGLKTDLEGAKDANVVIVSERLRIKTQLDSVSASLVAARDEVNELQERNRTLESDIQTIRTKVTDLEGKADELDKLSQQHKELEERATTLQADIDRRTEGDAALQAEKDQLKADKTELDALRETLEDASAITKLTEEKAELESRIKDLEEQAETLKAEEVKLKDQVDSFKIEADKVPGLTDQHEVISAQLAAVTQALDRARAASEAAAGQARDLQAQVNKLQSRAKSRSSSRPKKHDRSRSTGLVFMRTPGDKGAGIFVTTREALRAAD